jgi:hypothetical protein
MTACFYVLSKAFFTVVQIFGGLWSDLLTGQLNGLLSISLITDKGGVEVKLHRFSNVGI